MHYTPYRDLLLKIFPNYLKVRKLPLNGGMSCPNLDGTKGFSGCSYCNNRSFSPVFDQAKVSIQEQLDTFVPRLREKYPHAGILAYLQPYTNTHAPLEHLKGIIDPIIKHEEIAGLAIGTRPDCLEDEKIAYLAEMNRIKPIIVEIGLQTANDLTLAAINRRHTLAEFEDAVKRCQAANLTVTTHVIVGLPGETMKDFKRLDFDIEIFHSSTDTAFLFQGASQILQLGFVQRDSRNNTRHFTTAKALQHDTDNSVTLGAFGLGFFFFDTANARNKN